MTVESELNPKYNLFNIIYYAVPSMNYFTFFKDLICLVEIGVQIPL